MLKQDALYLLYEVIQVVFVIRFVLFFFPHHHYHQNLLLLLLPLLPLHHLLLLLLLLLPLVSLVLISLLVLLIHHHHLLNFDHQHVQSYHYQPYFHHLHLQLMVIGVEHALVKLFYLDFH